MKILPLVLKVLRLSRSQWLRPIIIGRIEKNKACLDELEGDGKIKDYAMNKKHIFSPIKKWISLNKKPPTDVFDGMAEIRAKVRTIAIEINQAALAANRLANYPTKENQVDFKGKYKNLPDNIEKLETLITQAGELKKISDEIWKVEYNLIIDDGVKIVNKSAYCFIQYYQNLLLANFICFQFIIIAIILS